MYALKMRYKKSTNLNHTASPVNTICISREPRFITNHVKVHREPVLAAIDHLSVNHPQLKKKRVFLCKAVFPHTPESFSVKKLIIHRENKRLALCLGPAAGQGPVPQVWGTGAGDNLLAAAAVAWLRAPTPSRGG